jgi:hypothetical protein
MLDHFALDQVVVAVQESRRFRRRVFLPIDTEIGNELPHPFLSIRIKNCDIDVFQCGLYGNGTRIESKRRHA